MSVLKKVLNELCMQYDVTPSHICLRTRFTPTDLMAIFNDPNPNMAELLQVVSAIFPSAMFCVRTPKEYVAEYCTFAFTGKVLKRVREASKVTQKQVGSSLGRNASYVAKLESLRGVPFLEFRQHLDQLGYPYEIFIYTKGKTFSLI